MKKYLKITGDVLWQQNEITKEDLGRLKDGSYDAIVDTYEGKYFDVEENEWKEIEGDE